MLNIVVVYGSLYVGGSIVHQLSQLKNLAIVGQSREGKDAVHMIGALRPHVVIIDAELKEGLGLEVLQQTKQFELPPVVFMTAASSFSQYRRECMRQGADYYFQLPDEIEGLVNTLSQLASLFSTVDKETKSEIENQKKNQKGIYQ
jgi:two-component system, response regulator YesN